MEQTMNKYTRQTYRMIMGNIAFVGIALCIEAVLRETECCPKGGQFAGGFAMIMLAYIGWPANPDRP